MKIRWGRAELSAPVTAKIRWGRAELSGTLAVVVAPLANLSGVEPETAVSVTATANMTPDSWTVRAITGNAPDLAISSDGAITLTAPSDIDGTTVTVGVTATKDSVTSTEVTFTITVLPQTEWWWTGSGWTAAVDTWA